MDKTKELGLELIKDKGREIAWLYFLKPSNQPDILQKLKPKRYEKYKNSYNKVSRTHTNVRKGVGTYKYSGNDNNTSDCFNNWEKSRFVDEVIMKGQRIGKGGTPYFYPKKKYILNICPIFYYLKEKKKLKINDKVKFILNDFLKDKKVKSFLFKLGQINNNNMVDTIISFVRYIYNQTLTDVDTAFVHHFMLERILDKKAGKEYFKIIPLVEKFLNEVSLMFKEFRKIDEAFEYAPFLERTKPLWLEKNYKPTNRIEKQIVLFLTPKFEHEPILRLKSKTK